MMMDNAWIIQYDMDVEVFYWKKKQEISHS
jgi:hypothetical protein